MLALPAAFVLAFAFYLSVPGAKGALLAGLARLYMLFQRPFTDKKGRTDKNSALAVYLLLLGGFAAIVSALHPILCALVTAPLFGGFSQIPRAGAVKRLLDGGSLSSDTKAYEALVRKTCQELVSPFACGVIAPLLLCTPGMLLWIGSAPGWIALALRAADVDCAPLRRILLGMDRIADGVLHGLLLLCSCLAGRSPLRTAGRNAQQRLMSVLALEENDPSGHAPVSGDISQAAFICCFGAGLLCALLTLCLLPFAL